MFLNGRAGKEDFYINSDNNNNNNNNDNNNNNNNNHDNVYGAVIMT